MSSIYPNAGRLYFRMKVGGKWKGIRTEFKPGQERQARAMLGRLEAQLAAGETPEGTLGPPTVATWLPKWLGTRKVHVRTWRNDETVMRLHVLPRLGAQRLDEVRPKHIVDLVRGWRARTGDAAMAPKSIYTAYSTVSAFFRDAALEDLIAQTPCVLTKHQLGPRIDKNPEWRHTAKFGREELELLISDERVPMDRRVYYALQGIAGMRTGEVSGLLWRNALIPVPEYPNSLDMILVAYSYGRPFPKGDIPRPVPVHPTLAAILAEWKLTGWQRMFGRPPTPDDLVIPLPPDAPSKKGRWRSKDWVLKRFSGSEHIAGDLETLGLRHRRGHDLRRTCISLARSDGALRDIHRRTTHKPPKEVIEGYTSFEWPVLVREVLKLQVKRHDTGKVLPMPRAAAGNDDGPRWPDDGAGGFATPLATESERSSAFRSVAMYRRPESNRADASTVEHGRARSTSPVVEDSGTYGNDARAATSVEGGFPNEGRSSVASALAELLELGASGIDPEHPAMKRAAAVLPEHWRARPASKKPTEES